MEPFVITPTQSGGPAVEIREGTPADTGPILELMKTSLGEGTVPRSPAYWSWKHRDNPFGASPVLVAEAGGALVGLRVFMRWAWRSGAHTVAAVRAVDTATHPEWQGRGIFSRLTVALVERVQEEGVSFVFNTPNRRSRPGYLKMGWQAVGRLDLWLQPLRPLRIARALATRSAAPAPEQPDPDASTDLTPAGELLTPGCDLEALLSTAGGADADVRLSVQRSLDYLRWRYVAIPGFRYHALADVDGGAGALVVFRYRRRGALLELRVCELVVGPGPRSRRVARALLARARSAGEADYVSAMAAPGTPEHRVLLGAGFLPAPRVGPILTVRLLNATPSGLDPLRRRSWRTSLGDMELF